MCYYKAMTIKDAVLGSADFSRLAEEISGGKNPKTTLLISKDEEYSFEFARLLACSLFNDGQWLENEHYAKVMASSHPDLKTYPLKNQLLVADSEEIVFESSVKPIFAGKKIFIIKNIEKSMEASQNKLLKTLEEPSKDAYFILTTANPDLVLPTIKSRCSKVELGKLPPSVIGQVLDDNENKDIILALSDGLIGKAKKLATAKNIKGLFEGVLSCLTKMATSKEVLAYSKKLAPYKEDFPLLIETFSVMIEELIFIRAGKSNLGRLGKYGEELSFVIGDYTIDALVEIQKLLSKAVREMSYNCNFTLVVENLLLNILEVKYLCK